jgi:hypothetical protein
MPKLPTAKPKAKSKLAAKLQEEGAILPLRRNVEPVWKGPQVDGITFSLLSRFLCCRERFRLLVVEGLRTKGDFNQKIEYGQMWHVCEEAVAERPGDTNYWQQRLLAYAKAAALQYRMQAQEVDKWYNVCKMQFPVYLEYWSKHSHTTTREPVLQEQKFNVEYQLPSGRVVKLRGKWDSADLTGTGKHRKFSLQENKTKGQVIEQRIRRQLKFDLQTMIYVVALDTAIKSGQLFTDQRFARLIGGVDAIRYNVVRRPLSGGKGSIVRHKPTKKNPKGESKEGYFARLQEVFREAPQDFFARWEVSIAPCDIEKFKKECFNPILEALCDWWEWISSGVDPFDERADGWQKKEYNPIHWRHPFGIWNPLDEGIPADLDEYLDTGSTVGLIKVANLFPELV